MAERKRRKRQCSSSATGSLFSDFLAWGRGRGGPARIGGLVWLDWNTEFTPIEGLNQIVGHSSGSEVRVKRGVNSINYCI
jgi:hypothetical protein